MQQLNVLSMKVSQNVESKDDSTAFTSTEAKEDFIQHIDSHLAKNKEVNYNQNKNSDRYAEAKADNSDSQTSEQNKLTPDVQSQDKSESPLGIKEENNSVLDVQDVAANGKKDEVILSEIKTDKTKESVDESELLMSFLSQADKTLIEKSVSYSPLTDNNSVDEKRIKNSENSTVKAEHNAMSEEQKAKYDTELLLKSSSLVADLSNVAKAVTSNTEVPQIPANQTTIENVNNKQVVTQQLIDADLLSDDVNNIATSSKGERLAVNIGDKVNKETIAHQPINLAKLTENVAIDSLDEHKKTVEINQQSQNKNPQQLVNTDVESKLEKLSNETTADNKNKNVQQVSIEANKNNSLGDIAATEKSAANIETTANVKNSAQPAINASMVSVTQSTMSQSTAAQNLASQVASKNTVAITGNTATETVAKESTSIEPEIELSAEYAEQLIEQSKAGSVDKDKNSNTIVKPTTSRDTSLSETNFIGDANRTTQATDDRVTQQSADAFNLTGSAEVTQSQKTNTQLHQETISIFRRDFSDAVKDKVMLMISQKLQQFDITLDPPELGNMQVRVNLQGEQATVNFVVQNQQAKESIEQNLHKLKDLLAEQGVDVGDANVEQQSQQSDTEGNKNESAKGNTNSLLQNTADANDVVQRDLSAVIHDSSAKGIDYYA